MSINVQVNNRFQKARLFLMTINDFLWENGVENNSCHEYNIIEFLMRQVNWACS